jgi:hypothetical protein
MQKGNRLVVEKAYLTLQGLLNGGNGEDSGELRNAHIILLRAESLFYQGTGFGINSTAYNQKFQFTEYINIFLPSQAIV